MRIRDWLLDFVLIAVMASVVTMLPSETHADTPDVSLTLFSAWFATGLLAFYCLSARWANRLFGIGGKHFAVYLLAVLLAGIAFAALMPISGSRAGPVLVLVLLTALGYLFGRVVRICGARRNKRPSSQSLDDRAK